MAETVQKKQYLNADGLSTFWGKIKGYVDDADATKLDKVLAGAGIEVADDKKTVAVKINNTAPGNVMLTADSNGLKANVTIPEATVTGVADNDKFLSLDNKLVSAAVSLSYDSTAKKIYLCGKDSTHVSEIDTSDFVKDGILQSVVLDEKDQLMFTWNADSGKTTTTIDLSKFIDNVEFNGDTLLLTDLTPVDKYTAPASNDSLNTAIAKLTKGITNAMDAAEQATAKVGVTSLVVRQVQSQLIL